MAASASAASRRGSRAATPRPARPAPCSSNRKPSAPATASRSMSASSRTVRAIIGRVPVSSWAMPPDNVVRCASGNPAARNMSTSAVGLGEVGHRARQVAVGVAVGEQPADDRARRAEVDAVTPTQDRVVGVATSSSAMRPPGRTTRAELGEERLRGRAGCAARTRTWRRRRRRRGAGAAARRPEHEGRRRCDRRAASRRTGRRRSARGRRRAARGRGRRSRKRGRARSSRRASASSSTVRRRQPTSIRNVMTRFTRS